MTDTTHKSAWRPVLLVACLVGLTRFYRLGEWSLWFDEAVTVSDAWHGTGHANPFGYWLVRLVAEASGSLDVLVLRLPAAILGWCCIPLTWWAMRTVYGDLRASTGALLLGLSPWALYWSQNARFYCMAQAACLVGVGIVLRGLDRGSLRVALAGLIVTLLGCGFHPTAAFLASALCASCLAVRPGVLGGDGIRRALPTLVLLGVICTPWALSTIQGYVASKDTSGLSSLLRLIKSTGFFLSPSLAAAALFGGVLAWRESAMGRVLALVPLLVLLGAGLAALFAASSAQYVFVMLPVVCVLAAWPVQVLSRPFNFAWGAVLAAPLAAGSTLYFAVRHGERPRWEEAYRYAWEERGEDDLIMGMQAPVGEFYLNPGSTDLRRPTAVAALDRTSAHLWRRWADTERPLWLIVRPDFLTLWDPADRTALRSFLTGECRQVARFDVPLEGRNLDLEVWHRPEPSPLRGSR